MSLFERLLQRLRINRVKAHIPPCQDIVDLGCDHPPRLLQLIHHRMSSCIGIDTTTKASQNGNIQILNQHLLKTIALPDQSADVITILAVLEHMPYPQHILNECFRILRPQGRLLITVPTINSEPLLKLFSTIGLIRLEMINQHHTYFNKQTLKAALIQAGFQIEDIRYFQFGLNLFAFAIKPLV